MSAGQDEHAEVSQHGTCAIALATDKNVALIVDTKLSRLGTTNSCAENNFSGCKAVLVRKDILLAVTGVFNDEVDGVNWKVGEETKKLLLQIPPTFERSDLSRFAESWFQLLVRHYKAKKHINLDPAQEVSTLIIATRLHNVPFLYKITITYDVAKGFEWSAGDLAVGPEPQLMYAGSCHDNINSHFWGKYTPAVSQPTPLEKWEIQEIGDRKRSARSVADFVPVLKDYEQVFTRVSEQGSLEHLDGKCP